MSLPDDKASDLEDNSIRYTSLHVLLDEEERELMNPDNWDWGSVVEGEPMPNVGAILPIHFSRDEIGPLQRLAHAQGMTAHAFIKQAALARVSQDAPGEPTEDSSSRRRSIKAA